VFVNTFSFDYLVFLNTFISFGSLLLLRQEEFI